MQARPKLAWAALSLFAALGLFFWCAPARGEQTPELVQSPSSSGSGPVVQANEALPDEPKPQNEENGAGTRSTRVFGVMPNELTVEGAAVMKPLSVGEKFKLVTEGAFDPYEFAVVGILAGIGQATNNTPQWGQGAKGYGIRYGTNLGDLLIGNYMVGAVFPVVFRQDPRYFQSGKGTFWRRTWYALSRVAITQSDSGKEELNVSELGGNAVAGVISNTYHPAENRSFGQASQTWATQLAVDAVGFELKEFWPDIRRRFVKRK